MDQVVKYNVYAHGELVASYDNQAPATTYAAQAKRRHTGVSLEVVEEVFGHVSSRVVRRVVDGKIYKASKCS